MGVVLLLLAIPIAGALSLWALGERDSAPEANCAFSFATLAAAIGLAGEVICMGPVSSFDE